MKVSDQNWPVCYRCDRISGALDRRGEWSFACLFLAACEIERGALSFRRLSDGERKHVRRLQKKLRDGSLRAVCPCSACEGVRTGVVARGSIQPRATRPVDVTGVPLKILKGLRDEVEVIGFYDFGDGFADRLPGGTSVLRPVSGPLGLMLEQLEREARAQTRYERPADSGLIRAVYEPLLHPRVGVPQDAELRAVQDYLSRQYWADVAAYGPGSRGVGVDYTYPPVLRDIARRRPFVADFESLHPEGGYYDGPYWVETQNGECFLLPEEVE